MIHPWCLRTPECVCSECVSETVCNKCLTVFHSRVIIFYPLSRPATSHCEPSVTKLQHSVLNGTRSLQEEVNCTDHMLLCQIWEPGNNHGFQKARVIIKEVSKKLSLKDLQWQLGGASCFTNTLFHSKAILEHPQSPANYTISLTSQISHFICHTTLPSGSQSSLTGFTSRRVKLWISFLTVS